MTPTTTGPPGFIPRVLNRSRAAETLAPCRSLEYPLCQPAKSLRDPAGCTAPERTVNSIHSEVKSAFDIVPSFLLLRSRLGSTEVDEVLGLEIGDVVGLAEDVLTHHADVDVGTLLEQLGCLGGITQQED